MLKAPFQGQPTELIKMEHRFDSIFGLAWGEKNGVALLHDNDRDRRWVRTFLLNADQPTQAPRVIWDRSSKDRYRNPGQPVTRTLPNGQDVLWQNGDAIYLTGWAPHESQQKALTPGSAKMRLEKILE